MNQYGELGPFKFLVISRIKPPITSPKKTIAEKIMHFCLGL